MYYIMERKNDGLRKPYDLAASIVLYNNDLGQLQHCISSFLTTSLNVKLYLIDNSESDDLGKVSFDSRVSYHHTGANLGFGKAHNIAIRRSIAESPFHLVLNPDISFNRGTLENIVDFARDNSDVGLIMPKILNANGELQYLCKRLPSPVTLILRRFFKDAPAVVDKFLRHYEMREKDYDVIFSAPNLSGCFMFFRSEALQSVGGFDERYFMYMEDIDIARRVHMYYKTVYFPHVQVTHGHERASYRFNKLFWMHILSAIKYFNKWGWFYDPERLRINKSI